MNYQSIYDQLIAKRQQNKITKNDCYCERHHSVPKSLGGSDDDNNKINLTAKEHYIAHLLLVKITEQKFGKDSDQYEKMIRAVTFFNTCKNNNKLVERKSINFNSRIYAHIRKEFAKTSSIYMTGKLVGKKNGMYGRKRTKKEKEKISKTRLERGCGKGKNNSMYGKPCYYKMTPEEYVHWKTQIKETCINKKFKHIYNPITFENKMVPLAELQDWLNLGYIEGQYNKHRRSTKGMRKVCLPIKNAKQVWVQPYEVQNYLDNGYVLWKDRVR